jgi:hypothetical protein
MADVEYRYLEVVPAGLAAARARVPRIQDSAITHFGEDLSRDVARGNWHQIDAETIVDANGQDVIAFLEKWLSTRSYALVPEAVVDAADDTWTSGDLGKQGQRWREVRAAFSPGKEGDKLANEALAKEAAVYGVKPGTTEKGVAPGAKSEPAGNTNPYSDDFKGSADAREKAISKLVRSNATLAASLARSCNRTLTGQPIAVAGKRFVDPKASRQ